VKQGGRVRCASEAEERITEAKYVVGHDGGLAGQPRAFEHRSVHRASICGSNSGCIGGQLQMMPRHVRVRECHVTIAATSDRRHTRPQRDGLSGIRPTDDAQTKRGRRWFRPPGGCANV
jgi:hypothetical protein